MNDGIKKSSGDGWRGWLMVASLVLTCSAGWGQAAPSGSLADAARQARAQKQSSGDVSQAQQVADELSEDQNDSAPGGFKTYNSPAYKVSVPAPFTIAGQDDGGTILSGPKYFNTSPLVFVGNAIVIHEPGEDALNDVATQFVKHYAQSVTCNKSTVAGHPAYSCGLAAANLQGHSVGGNAIFVRIANNVYPLMCVATTESSARDTVNDPHASLKAKLRARQVLVEEDGHIKEVWQRCDTVFASIHFNDNAGAQQEVVQTAKPVTNQGTQVAQAAQPAADVQSAAASPVPQSTAPEGFKIHSFTYCRSANQCWDASIFVPSDAKLVSSTCKQFIFESKIQGTSFLLMAGPAGGECGAGNSNADLVRWKQLVDPENKRAPGTYSTISSLSMTVEGKPAAITTMTFRKGLDDWMGKRVEVESNGIPLVVGCIAPREHFADGEAICSAMIASLQLP